MKHLNIAIAGAGISGLTAAIVLSQKGFKEIQIYEQADELGEIGAGIQLGPNAVRLLIELGLGDGLKSISDSCAQGSMLRAQDNQKLAELPYSDYFQNAYGVPAYQLLRSDFHTLLLEKVRELGIRVHTSKKLSSVNYSPESLSDSVVMEFSGQTQATADMLIAADGIESVVSKSLFPGFPNYYSGLACWRAMLDREALGQDWFDELRVWVDSGQHLVAYPVAQSTKMNLVAIAEYPQWDYSQRVIESSVDELLHQFEGSSPELLSLISKVEETKLWGLFERCPLPKWHKKHVVLIGDAAHPMLPSLAQGAAQGIEDAVSLADCLSHISSSSDLANAFQHFYTHRSDRAKQVQNTARWNLEYFHQKPGLKRFMRHKGMSLGGKMTTELIARNYHWLYR